MDDRRPLRVCFVSLHYGTDLSTPDLDAYLRRAPIHRALPGALAARGHEVALVHLYPSEARFVQDGVQYRFIRPDPLARLVGEAVRRVSSRDPAIYQPALRALPVIRALRPDLIHFHGITLTWNLFLLRLALGSAPPPIVGHYHGGFPANHPLATRFQRDNLRHLARLLFTTTEHARPFVGAGLRRDDPRVVELVETSTTFTPKDRQAARARTRMSGDPVFVWVGRLHPIKDPLTAVRGFARIVRAWPAARLYLYYLTAELEPAVRACVSEHSLGAQVELRGRARFDDMEDVYNSADFLLQASRREFSGCAVLEGLACGLIPVLSEIPSFRAMTDGGRHGILFPVGDAEALARGVLAIPRADIAGRSAQARAWFERALSFEAMAARLEIVYQAVLKEKPARGGESAVSGAGLCVRTRDC